MKTALPLATALLAGLLFGIGLIVARMVDPIYVLGFLDIAGSWNPTLAFVMAGAVAMAAPAFAVARRRTVSLTGAAMRLPEAAPVDRALVIGSLVFGIGWGIAGFCPGPGLVALGMGNAKAAVFVIAMLCGMGVFELLEGRIRAVQVDGGSQL